LAEIIWTRESEIWLKDVYNYIADDDSDAAERIINNIYEKVQLLLDHPRIGYRYEPAEPREVRILLYEHYRITYLIKDNGDIVILGVFHGALEIDRYLL
jgi:toxin ParE1/3/4